MLLLLLLLLLVVVLLLQVFVTGSFRSLLLCFLVVGLTIVGTMLVVPAIAVRLTAPGHATSWADWADGAIKAQSQSRVHGGGGASVGGLGTRVWSLLTTSFQPQQVPTCASLCV